MYDTKVVASKDYEARKQLTFVLERSRLECLRKYPRETLLYNVTVLGKRLSGTFSLDL